MSPSPSRAAIVAALSASFVAIALVGPAAPIVSAAEPDAGTRRDSGSSISRIPPDPPPMVHRGQWIFDLRYDKGDIYLLGVHRIDLDAPQPTPRAMGRFAIELFEGPTVIERVRFDFPLLGAGTVDAGFGGPPSFEAKLVTRIGVMFPASERGTKLELWDRMTDRRWPLPWPPDDTRDGGR